MTNLELHFSYIEELKKKKADFLSQYCRIECDDTEEYQNIGEIKEEYGLTKKHKFIAYGTEEYQHRDGMWLLEYLHEELSNQVETDFGSLKDLKKAYRKGDTFFLFYRERIKTCNNCCATVQTYEKHPHPCEWAEISQCENHSWVKKNRFFLVTLWTKEEEKAFEDCFNS